MPSPDFRSTYPRVYSHPSGGTSQRYPRRVTALQSHPAPRGASPRRISAPIWVGLLLLGGIVLACVASIPWTFGLVPVGGDGGRMMPAYEAGEIELNLLPPWWLSAAADPEERKRLEDAREAGRRVPGRWLGTDRLGRDVLVRCLAGGGVSLAVGILSALVAVIVGTAWGSVSGFAGGRVDAVMMRCVDVLYGLPSILLVVLLAVAADGLLERSGWQPRPGARRWIDLGVLFLAIGGIGWLTLARVVRGQVLSLRKRPFMEACEALGVPRTRRLLRHVLPNLTAPILVYATLAVPTAMLSESFLSFLGIGIREPLPSWGNLAAEGLSEMNPYRSRWWLLAAPCLLLSATLVGLNVAGDWCRRRFDPTSPGP